MFWGNTHIVKLSDDLPSWLGTGILFLVDVAASYTCDFTNPIKDEFTSTYPARQVKFKMLKKKTATKPITKLPGRKDSTNNSSTKNIQLQTNINSSRFHGIGITTFSSWWLQPVWKFFNQIWIISPSNSGWTFQKKTFETTTYKVGPYQL